MASKSLLSMISGILIGAAVALVIIGYIIIPAVKSFLPREIDDATKSSFEEVVRVVNNIKDGEIKKIVVDINEPFVIVGFSKNEDIQSATVWSFKETLGALFTDIKVLGSKGIDINFLKNPCNKACLCVCPFEGPGFISGSKLEGNACFKYKNKCVEFDGVNSFKGDDLLGGYFVLTTTFDKEFGGKRRPYEILLDKKGSTKEISVNIAV